ncbi:MAG TPA: aspartate aminotransferase family protein [Firmicutes bacterium]|nr:aspartate aminotransferase family protein [Bacillota bacterium]
MSMAGLLTRANKVLINNVRRFPVVFTRATGSRVYDAEQKEYLDFLSGIAVQAVGHSHPRITAAIQQQAEKIIHVSNYFYLEEQIELAEKLATLSGLDRVFFCNSGAEANEAAIKLARKYGRQQLGGKYEIISAYDSFHGRTFGALAATGQPKYQESFRPLPAGFRYAPFNNLQAWEEAISERTCALLLELVQGEGGVNPISPDFLKGLAEICRQKQILLIFDEVQTGLGRTGKYFAWQHLGIKPDILTSAKALGEGVPIGAMLASEKIATAFQPGDHSTTVGGGGLAFSVGLEVLRIMEEENLPIRASHLGQELIALFQKWQNEIPIIKEVRGWGLLLALELSIPVQPIVLKCFERGLLINAVAPKAIRLLPALNIEQQDLEEGLRILKQVLMETAEE